MASSLIVRVMNATKPKRFFYHYNKPLAHKQGRNVITIHWEGSCRIVNKIKTIGLDVESHEQKRQPRCIMRGFANSLIIAHNPDGTTTGIVS